MVQGSMESIKDQLHSRHADSEGRLSGVLTAESFGELLVEECPQLTEPDKHLISTYAVKGSRRVHGGQASSSAPVDLNSDLVQFGHFEKSMEEVIQHLRKETMVQHQAVGDGEASEELTKFRRQVDDELEKQRKRDAEHFGSAQAQRMQGLKSKVVTLF